MMLNRIAHSREFAKNGYVIAAIASNETNLRNLTNEIKELGGEVCLRSSIKRYALFLD